MMQCTGRFRLQCPAVCAGSARGVPLLCAFSKTLFRPLQLPRVHTSGVPPLSRKAALASARLEAVWTRSSSAASSRAPAPPFIATADFTTVKARRHLCRAVGRAPSAAASAAFMSCTPVGQPATPSRKRYWRAQGLCPGATLSCGPTGVTGFRRVPVWYLVKKPMDFRNMVS